MRRLSRILYVSRGNSSPGFQVFKDFYALQLDTIPAWEDISLAENHIKRLHRDLLKLGEKDKKHPGKDQMPLNTVPAFDKTAEQIGTVFKTAMPPNIPQHMAELVDWIYENRNRRNLYQLPAGAVSIVVFLEIHPLQDRGCHPSPISNTLVLHQAGYP